MNPITSDRFPLVEPRMQHTHHKNQVFSETFGHIDSALSGKPSKDTQIAPTICETIPSLSRDGLCSRPGVNSMSSPIKFLCSFGGRIMIRPGDGMVRYCGGETRIIALDRNLSYEEFIFKMAEICSTYTILKYQLPGEDLDALVSVSSDEDLQNLIDEYDKLESNSSLTRLRIFLFDDPSQCEIVNCCITVGAVEDCSPEVQFYVDTINGIQERMSDMHLEEGMDVISPHYIHEKRTTKYGSFYSANPFARAVSSAPSSPLISLRQAYPNPWDIVDTPFQASKEWTNAVSPEATRDIFVDTSSTLKCHQNEVFVKSPKLHQDMEFSNWEINLNADNPEMCMTQQCEYHHGSSIVTDTWNDVKHSCSRIPPQYQLKNHQFSQASDQLYRGEAMQYRHLEMYKQGPMFHPSDHEAALFHCHECYAPLKWTPDLDHQILSFQRPSPYLNVHDSHIQSVTSFYVDPSSSEDACTTCNRHQQYSQVHRRINGSTAEHKHNRILSHFGNQAIRSSGGLSFFSRVHDGVDNPLDASSWQQQSNHVKGLEVDEHDHKVTHFLEKKNVQYHVTESSVKEHAPDYVHTGFALSQHETQKENWNFPDFHGKQVLEQKKHMRTDCEGHFEELTDQQQNVEVEVRHSCKTRRSSRPLQEHQRDVESVQNSRNIISNSRNSRVPGTNQGDPLDHMILESVTFTLDDLPNVGHGISSFGSDSTSLSSVDDFVTMSRTTYQTQDLFDPIASAGKNQLKRNADHDVYHKENVSYLTETINKPENDYFWLSTQTDEDSGDEEIDVRLSYSTTFRPTNLFEDVDEKRVECLPVSSSAYKVAETGRGCSSLDANASGRFNKEGFSDSIKGQHMMSLSWPSGTLGWTNQNESSITFASPVFDRSPTSSINSRNSLLKNSEESFFLDSANWIKEDMSLEEELTNEKVSSIVAFPNERADGKFSEGEEDAIERHCNMIFGKGIGSVSKESTSPLHSCREWDKEAGANANIWEKSIRYDQVSGGLSSEVKESESDSFCFRELKKKSSVIEAEAEAIARGLQIIRNVDIEELRELGSGTYGTVFYGKWRGSDVAIKRIKSSCFIGCRPSVQERLISDFWSEAFTLSQLHHPNIVAFYGVVPDGPDGNLATVTEFMVNGSLKQVLVKKDRTIDRKKRLLIAMDTAFGMEYLHSKNVVHFDLKSENLLVNMRDSNRPVCKVGDFGLSKVKHHTLVSGGIRGTLPWMAPELLSEKHAMVTEKIDVYSFGIVMWELLTGEEPYANMHCGTIIGGIVNNTLRPLIPSWSDPSWKQLMERCWAADPADRPSFAMISSELRSIAAAMDIK